MTSLSAAAQIRLRQVRCCLAAYLLWHLHSILCPYMRVGVYSPRLATPGAKAQSTQISTFLGYKASLRRTCIRIHGPLCTGWLMPHNV